jgi:mannose-1-phosphate guanylyltransferase/mannose-6-phosphate isomerase
MFVKRLDFTAPLLEIAAMLDSASTPIVSFVMSGGVGSRLWPLSREDNPKQFHSLAGERSMLVKTVERMAARKAGPASVFLVAAERHVERVTLDLAGVDLRGGRGIFEPVGRNTAAAVAVASQAALAEFSDALVMVVPSDHEISTQEEFWTTVERGVPAAMAGNVVVFGIVPTGPETGFGYIEAGAAHDTRGALSVTRFVEKPDLATAERYLAAGNFYWNAGIFLFRASVMQAAFEQHAAEIWNEVSNALNSAEQDQTGTHIPLIAYENIQSVSVDYAIIEKLRNIAVVPASFRWNDLGSWQSLLEVSPTDDKGNVIIGDVVAIDCEGTYLRSEGRLLSAIGLKDTAVVSTSDATFVAPVSQSQNVKRIVERLEKSGRLETKRTPIHDMMPEPGAYEKRVRHWLFQETLPLWSTAGVDNAHGGFHEALTFQGEPVLRERRTRTMARQIYAFAIAKEMGWDGPAKALVEHGIEFLSLRGRSKGGGWVKSFNVDGSVLDATEDLYDHTCILLALAHAHKVGNVSAHALAVETIAYVEQNLADRSGRGYFEDSAGTLPRRSNPHMHMLEACLAWHEATGDAAWLARSGAIVDLFLEVFFDSDSWTLGEFFGLDWSNLPSGKRVWTEPGHHFEWAWLLVNYAKAAGQPGLIKYARKLYASAIANGLNRATGLAYDAVSRDGLPLIRTSRSWPQTEVIKAAIALDGTGGPDMKPEIESRVGRLFRWHIDPAPQGLWIDLIDERGQTKAQDVPASIFYHLVCALTAYLAAKRE